MKIGRTKAMSRQDAVNKALRETLLLWCYSTHGQIEFKSQEDYETYLKLVAKYERDE